MATKRAREEQAEERDILSRWMEFCERSLELQEREVEALEKIAHELDHWPHGLYTSVSKR